MTNSCSKYKNLRKTTTRLLLSTSNVSRGLFLSVFGLLLNYILLHYKPVGMLDTYVYCMAFVNLLLVFNNWGGKEYTIQTLARSAPNGNASLSPVLNSRLILFIFLLLITFFVPDAHGINGFVAALLFFKALNAVFECLIIVQKRFTLFLIFDLLLNTVFLTGIFLVPFSTELFLAALTALEALRALISVIIFRESISLSLHFKSGFFSLWQSRHFFFTAFAGFVCSRADLYAVGIFLSPSSLSTYYILLNLVILCQVFYATFVSTFSSNIYRYSSDSFKKFEVYSKWRGLLMSALGTLAIYFISAFYYTIQLDSIFTGLIFLNLLSFSSVLIMVYHFTRLNRQKVILKVIVISGAVNILLSTLLTSPFGLKGAFISNTICMICTHYLFKLYSLSAVKEKIN